MCANPQGKCLFFCCFLNEGEASWLKSRGLGFVSNLGRSCRGEGWCFDYPTSSPGKEKWSFYGSPAKAMQLPHPWVRPSPWPSTWKQRSENIVNTFILMDGFSFTGRFIIQRWWCCLFGQGLGAGKTLKDDVKNIFIAGIYLKPKILRVHLKNSCNRVQDHSVL